MRVAQINTTMGKGSTGKICLGISELLQENGIENYILYSGDGIEHPFGIKYTDRKYIMAQALKSRIFGNYGFNSYYATQKLIAELDRFSPDIVHIHNIHGHDCQLEMLLSHLKEKHIKTVWTFHDCWCFTAYCPYFTYVKCSKWRTGCHHCVLRSEYSWFFDKSAQLYERKKRAFQELDLTIVTPSQWLADIVGQSFLKEYPVKVINNGIDLSVFYPKESDFREQFNPEGKKIVLGVADVWAERKGLDVFVKMSEQLPEDYRIVIVGTNEQIDRSLPDNIISIHRTNSQSELAGIYSAADVFVNPTREDNYPTVNMEALACGTPVITFQTGGSPEMLTDKCGRVVKCDDIDALIREICDVCQTHPLRADDCAAQARHFDQKTRMLAYLDLYHQLLGENSE